MNTLIILLVFFSLLFLILLFLQGMKFYRKMKQFSVGASIAKDISISKYDDNAFQDEQSFPTQINHSGKMDSELINEIADHKDVANLTKNKSTERRKHPRKDFQSCVEFIKEGTLFKEISKDLSYSGMFLITKMPDKYNIDDFIILTFQTSKGNPQKRRGQVVRKEKNGIGIQFLKE